METKNNELMLISTNTQNGNTDAAVLVMEHIRTDGYALAHDFRKMEYDIDSIMRELDKP